MMHFLTLTLTLKLTTGAVARRTILTIFLRFMVPSILFFVVALSPASVSFNSHGI